MSNSTGNRAIREELFVVQLNQCTYLVVCMCVCIAPIVLLCNAAVLAGKTDSIAFLNLDQNFKGFFDKQYLVLLNSSNTSSATVCGGVLASTSKLLIAMISSEWVPIF